MVSKIKLNCVGEDKPKLFDFAHAENLLNLEKRVGVQNHTLADEGFSVENGKIIKRSTGKDKAADKLSAPTEGAV